MATILALRDIGHTLIETRGVGGEIYAEAFQAVTGHRSITCPHCTDGETRANLVKIARQHAEAAHGGRSMLSLQS